MNVTRKPDVQQLIDDRVRSGRYASPAEVVEATVLALEQSERSGDFEAGEPDALLAEGERNIEQGGTLDGEEAFRMRAERRARRRNSPS